MKAFLPERMLNGAFNLYKCNRFAEKEKNSVVLCVFSVQLCVVCI